MVVTVIARYKAQPGNGAAVAAILAKHVVATRAEPGCLQFDACRSSDNADEFVLYEKYIDEEAFESHRQTAHFKAFVQDGIVPLLSERTWQRYEEI